MSRFAFEIRLFAFVCCSLALSVGCSSNGKPAKESAQAVESLSDVRRAVVDAKAQVNETTAALNAVAGGGDLKGNYARFSKAVAETQQDAERARRRGADMRARADAYVEKWHREMSELENPELRAGAEARRDQIRQRFEGVRNAAQGARDAYEPYMKNLQDIQKALSLDLTPQGVQTARPAIDKANADARTLNDRLDALIRELDTVSAGMSPTGKAVR